MNLKQSKINKIAVLFCVFAGIFVLVASFIKTPLHIDEDKPVKLDQAWDIYVDGVLQTKNNTLPYAVEKTDARFIDLYTTLHEPVFDVQAVSFVVFQKNVWVYLDDEMLAEHAFTPSNLHKTPGSGTVTAILPPNSEGRQLHVRLERVVDNDDSSIAVINLVNGAISVGSRYSNMLIMTLMMALVFIGLLMLGGCIPYLQLRLNSTPLISLALIILSLSMWILCNSKMIEMFTSNWILAHNLEYLSFYLLPLSMWVFIRHTWESVTKIPQIMTAVMMTFFAAALFLKCFFGVDFFQMLKIFHLLIIINIPLYAIELVKNYKTKPKSYRVFCQGVIVLSSCAVIELVRFYLLISLNTIADIFIWGCIVWVICLIFSLVFSIKEKMSIDVYKKEKEHLAAERRRYEVIIKNTQDILMDWDLNNDSVYFSERYEEYFGVPPVNIDLLRQLNISQNYTEYDRDIFEVYEMIKNGSPFEKLTGNFVHKDSGRKWFDLEMTSIIDKDKKPSHVIGMIRDVTKAKMMETEFASQNQYLQINKELYDNVLEADITQNLVIGDSSLQLAENLGLSNDPCYDDLINSICEQLTHEDYRESYREMMSRERILSLYEGGIPYFNYECKEKNTEGNYRWIRLIVRIFQWEQTNTLRILSYVKDIHEEKLREFELLNNSQTDSLSGLLNKGATRDAIEEILKNQVNEDDQYVFMMVDIDNFKTINDTLGHAAGDKVIAEIGQKFKHQFHEDDIVGRIGGDEFAIMFKKTEDMEALEGRCRRLCKEFSYTYTEKEKKCDISISIGVCIYPDPGRTYDELYQKADLSLYESKRNGRNTYSFFFEGM